MVNKLLMVLVFVGSLFLVACTADEDPIMVEDTWVRAAAGGNSAGYMTITNDGRADITLTRVEADFAESLEIHETSVEDDIARMQELVDGLVIPANDSVSLEPGGFHVMFIDVTAELVEGERAQFTLFFDNGSSIEVDAPIQVLSPEDMPMDMDMGDDSDMDMSDDEEMDMDDDEEMDMDATEEADE